MGGIIGVVWHWPRPFSAASYRVCPWPCGPGGEGESTSAGPGSESELMSLRPLTGLSGGSGWTGGGTESGVKGRPCTAVGEAAGTSCKDPGP